MAGIYIHIPFCKQACSYCNFHFATTNTYRDRMVDAICREIELRANELDGQIIETIYLGGGTPSILSIDQLLRIFSAIQDGSNLQFSIFNLDSEITLEANPDDLTPDYINMLRDTPINRLSIGVQSFFDVDLEFMNRAHNTQEAAACISNAVKAGFDKFTIDLIYGAPTTTMDHWEENIKRALDLGVKHISGYHLTVEPHTALAHQIKKGKVTMPSDEAGERHFKRLIEETEKRGWLHYEISNYAANESHIAVHNTNYWKGVPYLGIGPSAHSYDGKNRAWNVAHNIKYMDAIEKNELPSESELIDDRMRFNEYIMVGLRTMWGIETAEINPVYLPDLKKEIKPFIERGLAEVTDNGFRLTAAGKFLADGIASELMVVD